MQQRFRLTQDRLQRAENRCLKILQESSEGIFLCDRDCRLLQANPAMAKILGAASGEALVARGESLAAVLFGNEEAWQSALRRLDSGEELHALRTSFQRNDGCMVWGEFKMFAPHSCPAPCDQFSVIFQDTTLGNLAGEHARLQEQLHRERLEQIVIERTKELHSRNKELIKQIEERARIERALQEAKDAAEEANNAKSIFLASMSHEIRTPINAILGMSQMLAESDLNQPQVQYVRILKTAGEGLLTIINNILDISNYEAGQLHLETKQFLLADVVDKVIAVLRPHAQDKKLKLLSTTDPALPAVFSGDPLRLHQVLLNILSNAVKFTEHGEVRLHVETQHDAQHDAPLDADSPLPVRFFITDTGIGIAPQQQVSIFDYFTQADTSINRKYGGSGLGLAVSKVLVELMGGTIWFTSDPSQGSAFCFTVLLTPVLPVEAQHQPPIWHPSGPASAADFPTLRILVLEDSEFNAIVVESFLKDTGCRIDLAANGAIGLQKFQAGTYDLVLMDIQMPVMDGYTATRKIRHWETEHGLPETPIFAMTAYAMKGDRQKSLEAGCNLHLVKPIKKELLLGAIYAWFSAPGFGASFTVQSAGTHPPDASAGQEDPQEITVPVDPELFEIAPRFVETIKNNLLGLEELIAKEDFGTARTMGHQMKGEGKLFGLNPVSKLGLTIQQAAEAKDADGVLAAAHELLSYLERVRLMPSIPE